MEIKHSNNVLVRLKRLKIIKYVSLIGFIIILIIIINNHIKKDDVNPGEPSYIERRLNSMEKYRSNFIKKKKCRIAAIDPFSESAKQLLMVKSTPWECDNKKEIALIEANHTAIYINSSAHEHYYEKGETADCCWQLFERKFMNDNAVKFDPTCYEFNESAIINAEFIKVQCFKNGSKIYEDYHFFVPRKAQVENRCQTIEIIKEESSHKPSEDYLSILILGLDTMSRLHFHRTMPKTLEVLKMMGAEEILGYNKVADNTYPNLMPVLSGLSQAELESSCNIHKNTPYDNCSFVWKKFSAVGYRTVFGEDISHTTLFNHHRLGFKNQPTDYYFRPFIHTADDDLGNRRQLNYNLCIGARKAFDILLDYAKKIAVEFKSDRYFSFLWEASLTHDFLNHSQMGDDSYSETINYLFNQGLLNNTALIVMSDHGARTGEFRQTDQGRIESSLPLLFIALPEWWKKKFPLATKNLQYNSDSLITPFDLHKTLIDFMHPETLTDENIYNRYKIIANGNLPRGVSCFLTIPAERDCSMAEIPDQFCMCHGTIDKSVNDSEVESVASFAVDELNGILAKYPECSSLNLWKIMDAKVWNSLDGEESNDGTMRWSTYVVSFETIPGNAIFQATIKHDGYSNTSILSSSVDRLNLYDGQTWCMNNPSIEPYCYCHEEFLPIPEYLYGFDI